MRIALCEDDSNEREIFCGYIKNWINKQDQLIQIDCFENAERFLFVWPDKRVYDIIFLDISMGTTNGMELAHTIRSKDCHVLILFMTGSPQYLAEGYYVEAFRYLLKPIAEKVLSKALDDAIRKLVLSSRSLVIKAEGETIFLNQNEILFFESMKHHTIAHLQNSVLRKDTVPAKDTVLAIDRTYVFYSTFDQLENELQNEFFFRSHRSYLVNLQAVRIVHKNHLVLSNGATIPLGRDKHKAVMELLLKLRKVETQ